MSQQRALVTGGSGFIAGHCILQLLAQGYLVRATLRSLDKEATVRASLRARGMAHEDNLQFVAADLLDDDGWASAAADVDFVLHVASPVRPGYVENENDVIIPACEGTLRVLRASRDAGVRRVVLTSAFHAVSWGHPRTSRAFTETDWTVLDGPGVDAYGKSKTLAERAAWDFIEKEGGALQLVAMLPVAVMGPIVGKEISGANHVVQMMLERTMPALPDLYIPIVDVRDVARAHLLAALSPHAAGERFLLSNGPALALRDIATTIKASLGNAASRVPTRILPSVVIRVGARFSNRFRDFVHDLGYAKQTSNEKARRMLGWSPREPREAIVAAARSIVASGHTERVPRVS